VEPLHYETPPPTGKPFRVLVVTGLVIGLMLFALVLLYSLYLFLGIEFGWIAN
jgi:hypothetical protein